MYLVHDIEWAEFAFLTNTLFEDSFSISSQPSDVKSVYRHFIFIQEPGFTHGIPPIVCTSLRVLHDVNLHIPLLLLVTFPSLSFSRVLTVM